MDVIDVSLDCRFVSVGTVLSNYAHILELLLRLRQGKRLCGSFDADSISRTPV